MKLGILISGRGSNLRALVAAVRSGQIHGEVSVVISNVASAPGLAWAREQGLMTVVLERPRFASRQEHDDAMVAALEREGVEVVCLAGYMSLVGRKLLARYPHRVLNVHPSLLPSFPGLKAQQQAWDHGVRVSGATVHLVDEKLDSGPIIAQKAVPVLPDDRPEDLAARILEAEHQIYPAAVALVCDDRLRVEGRRVRLLGEE